jgi:hypothetical protein
MKQGGMVCDLPPEGHFCLFLYIGQYFIIYLVNVGSYGMPGKGTTHMFDGILTHVGVQRGIVQ